MVRVLVQTGKAVSLCEVSRQIALVGERRGYVVTLNRYTYTHHTFSKLFDAVIFVYPCSPVWCLQWFYFYMKAKRELNGKALYYTTIEGKVKSIHVPEWARRECEFVACSNYVADKLREAGLRVRAVVHHAVHVDSLQRVEQLSQQYITVLRQRFGDRVLFACVADDNFRKGLPELVQAVQLLLTKRKDFVVLLMTKKEGARKYCTVPHIVFVGEFGTRDHDEVMAFYRACHYLVFPTHAEGFGLPLAEANLMSRPAVVTDLPVFHEYADMRANIPVKVTGVQLYDNQDGVLYELHMYDPRELAQAMDYAIDLYRRYRSEYEDRCVKVHEKVKHMTAENQYGKLYELLGM